MKIWIATVLSSVTLVVFLWADRTALFAQQVIDSEQATKALVVQNLKLEHGSVSGEVLNRLSHPIREVELLIRHVWFWKNEFRPGTDDPGMAVYHTVDKDIPPGGGVPFTHELSAPLPERADGFFETVVSVAGFAEIIPQ